MRAPASIDAAVALLRGEAIVLAEDPSAPMLAALAAGVRGSACTVLAGTAAELARAAEAMAAAAGPGRLLLAREWLLDEAAALYGRRGAALAPAPEAHPRLDGGSPLPVAESVRRALARAAAEAPLERYPTEAAATLEAEIAARLGVEPAQVVVSGGGSGELVSRVLRACTDPGDEVLARRPVWDALAGLCAAEGLVLRLCDDPTRVPAGVRLVYLASPNNPDSRRVAPEELSAVRRALPRDRVVVLDEAWRGFDDPPSPCAPGAATPDGPIVVLRTFSKALGLAGLRVGYAVAPTPVASLLRRFGPPGGLGALATQAARAALADEAQQERVRAAVRVARERLVAGLRAHGVDARDTGTHVVVLRGPKERLEALRVRAEHSGVALDEPEGMPDALVLAVPAPEAVEQVLAALA